MTVSLLARAEGIVSTVGIDCPDVEVRDRTIPFGAATGLGQRLIEAGGAIGVVPVVPAGGVVGQRVIVGGTGEDAGESGDIHLVGAGWWGGVAIGRRPESWVGLDHDRDESIGPYVAACLAIAEVFLKVRAPQLLADRPGSWGWNSWFRSNEAIPADLGPSWDVLDLSENALAGVGAVGAAWMHTVWSAPRANGRIVVADADAEGVSISNLNRGLLFRRADVERPKATTAAEAAVGTISWLPFNGRFEAQDHRPRVLVSAVDNNRARDVLQSLYSAYFVSGSTRDLRAEVVVGGDPGVGACLRCFNPPEVAVSDDELRARAARDDSASLAVIAADLGVQVESVEARLQPGSCDALSDRLLERLRRKYGDEAPAQFAVGFGSVMAGVLLAAETIRFAIDEELWPSTASDRVTFQLQHPSAESNRVRAYFRDLRCPKCDGGVPALPMWRARRAP